MGMKVKTIVCKLMSFLTITLFSAQGATLYVSTSGSDSNPGTSAQPFRTITHAYGLAGPGTTILVLPGVYTDYTSGWGLHLGASGTASSPIVLQSQVRGAAVLQVADDQATASNEARGIGSQAEPPLRLALWPPCSPENHSELNHFLSTGSSASWLQFASWPTKSIPSSGVTASTT